MSFVSIIFIFLFIILWIGFMLFCFSAVFPKKEESIIDREHVNENSFQNYAKFYGEYIPSDDNFDQKMNKICTLITKHNMTDIKKIASMSLCTIPECVLKIRYLKNKRYIGDYYIDTVNMELLPCSEEDQKLLEKYSPFIYGSHVQVEEMANVVHNPNGLKTADLRDEIYHEIESLYDKGLLNGIKLNPVDRRIIYYTIEKRKIYPDKESVHCPNCGALNDVDIHGKVRCGYCQTIIRGRENYEEGS